MTGSNRAGGSVGRWAARLAALAAIVTAGACATGPSEADAPPAAPEAPGRPAAGTVDPAAPVAPVSFAAWRAGFRDRALAAGIPAGLFDEAFAGVRVNETVLERDRFQPEFVRPIWEYIDSAVSEARVANGRREYRGRSALLGDIGARFGVDPATVVAIWGLESAYGAVMGDIRVIESLATLAHDGRRQDFAEDQLLAALRILRAGDVTPGRMIGSWAGAMGHTQFIPTSFESYAVDFTGDGRRDIWAANPSDALASAANYLAEFGWQTGAPAVVRVRLPQGFDYALADQEIRRPVADWQALGVSAVSGDLPPGEAAVLLPAGARGPAWLAYRNFRVIKRYNNATSYALAVALLADRIAGRAGAGDPAALSWPRGDRALSRSETEGLQRRLTALGYETGGVDGIVGPNTRSAVRAFQADRGLIPDGYVSDRLLAEVQAAGG